MATALFGLSLISTRTELLRVSPKSAVNSNRSTGAGLDLTIQTAPEPGDSENWSVNPEPLLKDIGANSIISLADGTVRLYFVQNGRIVYRDSSDGLTFSSPQPTGVGDDLSLPYEQQPLVADPAVLQISTNDWLMVFSQAVRQKPNVPQVDQPKNLYLARSRDGQSFDRVGSILDSTDNDSGLAEQPSLLMLPDGRIRLFYLSRGDRIASLISEDRGTRWFREGERISRSSSDPYAVYYGGYYAVYYSAWFETVTDQGSLAQTRTIRKAVSTDGVTFTKGRRDLINFESGGGATDPSYVQLSDGRPRLYFRAPDSTGSNVFNLYSATLARSGSFD